MNDWQNRMISPSERPLGSKSDPPLPPPIGMPVSAFLNTCSKPRNLTVPSITEGWKPQSALVRPEHRIELDAEAAVDLHFALVGDPRHAENDLPLRLADALDQRVVGVARMLGDDRAQRLEHLPHRLMEFIFTGVTAQHVRVNWFEFLVEHSSSIPEIGHERALDRARTSARDRGLQGRDRRRGAALYRQTDTRCALILTRLPDK